MSGAVPSWSNRTIFLSDLHLGSRLCTAGGLLDFLKLNSTATLFLVGDAFDFWSMRRRATWGSVHAEVLHLICRMMQTGTRVVLIPGNHDDQLRGFVDIPLRGLEIHREWVHVTAAGLRYLVVHGDEHDVVMHRAGHLAPLGCALKEQLACLARPVRRWMRRIDEPSGRITSGWTLMRRRIGGVARLEAALVGEARTQGAHGVVCGHTHLAADEDKDGIHYMNCGDWVGSSTAIVESWSGRMDLVRWDGRLVLLSGAAGASNAPNRADAIGDLVSARTSGGVI